MNDAMLGQIEGLIINIYLPGLGKGMSKKIRRFCKEKGIAIYNDNLRKTLEGVEAAIIRHRYTDYDSIVKVVGKERARFYIGQEGLNARVSQLSQAGAVGSAESNNPHADNRD